MYDFNPFPVIETRRLKLRALELEDQQELFLMRSDPIMHQHTDSKPDANVEETAAYIERMQKGIQEGKWILWALDDKETGRLAGSISIWNIEHEQFSAELGYGMAPSFQGKGLMKEALAAVAAYGFGNMALKVLTAYTEENNLPSIRLLKRSGFVETDRVVDEGFVNHRQYIMIVYALKPDTALLASSAVEGN